MPNVEFRTRATPTTPWELSPVVLEKKIGTKTDKYPLLVHRATQAAQALADELQTEVGWNFENGFFFRSASPRPKPCPPSP